MATQTTGDRELSSADYVEQALDDLNRARQDTEADLASRIDSAIGRMREALARIQAGAGDRAEHLKALVGDRAAAWDRLLKDASDEDRQEMAIRSVRAQRSPDALKAIRKETRHQKKEIKRHEKESKREEELTASD